MPDVPDLGAGTADIGHGEQVEGGEPALGADDGGKTVDHVGVSQVVFLRYLRHRQMMFDQEDDQFGVLPVERVLDTEFPRILHPEFRMVAAASFGDVVEQCGDVEQPATFETRHQPRAERIFMGELGHGETAQIAHDLKDVLIHRVDVEQVVLHLADDAAEGG